MSTCCPPGSLGPAPLSERTPLGSLVTWQALTEGSNRPDLSCYQVGGKNVIKRVIVVFTDVYGLESGNHKVFCDVLQACLGEETLVCCPDLFRGRPLMRQYGLADGLNFALGGGLSMLWGFQTRCSAIHMDADLADIIEPNVRVTGCDVCGVVGFCFGGWIVARSLGLHGGQCIFRAGVGIHPAFKIEPLVRGGTSAMALGERTGTKPILLLPAKQDHDVKASNPVIQDMAKRRGTTPDKISIEFPDMPHGWVARGDFLGPQYKQAQEEAIDLTVKFIQEHLQTSNQVTVPYH